MGGGTGTRPVGVTNERLRVIQSGRCDYFEKCARKDEILALANSGDDGAVEFHDEACCRGPIMYTCSQFKRFSRGGTGTGESPVVV
ncbi:MAG: hypothetical protein KJ718_01000 [Nanoarchaeota archaeon]|nr:hypothetical protein [Nanoarchaeota archaeon]MBU1051113.1 hypothetical protein [Nanoarchaeota archaeon]